MIIMISVTDKTPQEQEISFLLKRATAQAKEKDYDAAIANLIRAYSLMETVSTEQGIKTYFRLARYYRLAGRYEDALAQLQKLHAKVDSSADAREKLYAEWGWMQKGGPAKISQIIRDNYRKLINDEIALLKERQRK